MGDHGWWLARWSRCRSWESTRRANSINPSKWVGNSLVNISLWIRSANPCRNMSHCASSFHLHSAARVRKSMEKSETDLSPWRRSASLRAASRPTTARSKTLLISSESAWNEEQQEWWFSHTAVPHRAAFPDSRVRTNATLDSSVANVCGCREKNIEHFTRKARHKSGSPVVCLRCR